MPMLTGPQIKPFQQALLSAFTRQTLTQMLLTELNKQFDNLVKEADFDYQVFQLIDRANREGWAYKLLLVAASYNPGNPDLQAYAAGLNLSAVGTPTTKDYASYCTSSVRSDATSGNMRRLASLRPWHLVGGLGPGGSNKQLFLSS